ncbi:MAG: YggS family pyridoxal phosphate-dependent enzyme [Planctomycetes bacterium]|nr:YggS family pyridoxal phosphate-dependent enzyme [Planctomycetota bacterium]
MKRKLAENWKRITERVGDACHRVGRDPTDVTIVAVTKSVTPNVIRTLIEMGIHDLGENRVQQLTKRAAMVNEWFKRRSLDSSSVPPPRPVWHMIGHLQRNKVAAVLPWVRLVHSVDSLRLAEEIDSQAGKLKTTMRVLLEVDAADEPSKYGVAVAATTHLGEQIASLPHIELCGLMAMAPLTSDESRIRFTFERVKDLFDEIVSEGSCGDSFRMLSLGMSNDFEYGIEAGATYIRIGSALFEGIELAPEPAYSD